MVDGSRWKPIIRAGQRGSAKKVLCLKPWSQDGWPSFRLAIYPFTLLIYRPLLAFWASHVHYSLSFLSPCSHFYIGIGAFWCMHALFGSLMSLGPTSAFFSHYFSCHHITAFHHISLVVFFIFYFLFYLLLVLLHVLFTLSSNPLQFIAWRIVTLFLLSITQTLI